MKDEQKNLRFSAGNLAKLISRGLAAYLFIWGVMEVTYLPERMHTHSHYLPQPPSLKLSPTQEWYLHHDDIVLTSLMVRIVLLFGGALLIYRGSPFVHAYFLSGLTGSESENVDGVDD